MSHINDIKVSLKYRKLRATRWEKARGTHSPPFICKTQLLHTPIRHIGRAPVWCRISCSKTIYIVLTRLPGTSAALDNNPMSVFAGGSDFPTFFLRETQWIMIYPCFPSQVCLLRVNRISPTSHPDKNTVPGKMRLIICEKE